MSKAEFLNALRSLLGDMAHSEVERISSYYGELLLDMVEGGMSEEDAVRSLGDPQTIAEEIRNNKTVNDAVSNPGFASWLRSLRLVAGEFRSYGTAAVYALTALYWILAGCLVIAILIGMLFVITFVVTRAMAASPSIGTTGSLIFIAGLAILAFVACAHIIRAVYKGSGWVFKAIYDHTAKKPGTPR